MWTATHLGIWWEGEGHPERLPCYRGLSRRSPGQRKRPSAVTGTQKAGVWHGPGRCEGCRDTAPQKRDSCPPGHVGRSHRAPREGVLSTWKGRARQGNLPPTSQQQQGKPERGEAVSAKCSENNHERRVPFPTKWPVKDKDQCRRFRASENLAARQQERSLAERLKDRWPTEALMLEDL